MAKKEKGRQRPDHIIKMRRCLFIKLDGVPCNKMFKSDGPGQRKCPSCRSGANVYQNGAAWLEHNAEIHIN